MTADATDQEAQVAAVRALRDQGRFQEAYQALLQLPWPQPGAELFLLRGALERQLGLDAQAEASLLRAQAHPPHLGFAWYELGELRRHQGRFNDAARCFLQALHHAPQHRWIHHALSYTRFSEALLPELEQAYRRHCGLYPLDAPAWHLWATLQLRLGQRDQAIATSRQAARLELGPRAAALAPASEEPTAPDFLIIGVPKGGTSSLAHWLGQHPRIWCHPRKELHFFNDGWEHGAEWYRAQFPRFRRDSGILRGEATPNYVLDPRVPQRILAVAPQARLILLLRDPLERAVSWIEHLRRFEGLTGSTEQLLLEGLAQMDAGEPPASPGAQALGGSSYGRLLEPWRIWPREQLLILRSEDLFADPEPGLQRCLRFLGLAALQDWPMPLVPQNVNPARKPLLSRQTRQRLRQALQPTASGYFDVLGASTYEA